MQMQNLPRRLRSEVTMYYSDIWVRSEGEEADYSLQESEESTDVFWVVASFSSSTWKTQNAQ
jgi:hypothetical protein